MRNYFKREKKLKDSSRNSKWKGGTSLNNIKLTWKYGFVFMIVIMLFFFSSMFVYFTLGNVQDELEAQERSVDRSIMLSQMNYLFEQRYSILMQSLSEPTEELDLLFVENESAFESMMEDIKPYLDTDEMKNLYDIINDNNAELNNIFHGLNRDLLGQQEEAHNQFRYFRSTIFDAMSIKNRTNFALEQMLLYVNNDRQLRVSATQESLESSSNTLIILFIVSLVIAVIMLLIIHIATNRRLNRVIEFSKELTAGKLQIDDIEDIGKDELAIISSTLNEMKNRLSETMRQVSEASATVGEKTEFLSNFSETIREDSSNVFANMQNLIAGMEEQSSTFTSVSDSVKEFTGHLDMINDGSQMMNESASYIQELTSRGNEKMASSRNQISMLSETVIKSNDKIRMLHERTDDIARFIRVIKEIAEQTNLLALNATIEAARAGQYGRGFAVVADEIRKLSDEVEKSVKQISSIVSNINSETKSVTETLEIGTMEAKESVKSINDAGEYFKEIYENINDMTEKVKINSGSINDMAVKSQMIQTAIHETAVTSEDAVMNVEDVTRTIESQQKQVDDLTQKTQELMAITNQLNSFVKKYRI